MKKILTILGLAIYLFSYSQIAPIENGESGLSVRNKINRNLDTSSYFLATKVEVNLKASNQDIIDSLRNLSYVKFVDNSDFAYEEGVLYYDADDYSLVYYNGFPAFKHQVGHELVFIARNVTGEIIEDGKPVFISGSTGEWPQISLASARTTDSANVAGFTTTEFANNGYGVVTIIGMLNNQPTGSYNLNNMLYLDTIAGQYDTIRKLSPHENVFLGTVVRVHASAGRILIKPTHFHKLGITGSFPVFNGDNDINALDTSIMKNENGHVKIDTANIDVAQSKLSYIDTIRGFSTDTTYFPKNTEFTGGVTGSVDELSSGVTISANYLSVFPTKTLTLGVSTTITVSNVRPGIAADLYFKQGGSGGYTVTLSGVTKADGTTDIADITTTVGTIYHMQFDYEPIEGVTYYFLTKLK